MVTYGPDVAVPGWQPAISGRRTRTAHLSSSDPTGRICEPPTGQDGGVLAIWHLGRAAQPALRRVGPAPARERSRRRKRRYSTPHSTVQSTPHAARRTPHAAAAAPPHSPGRHGTDGPLHLHRRTGSGRIITRWTGSDRSRGRQMHARTRARAGGLFAGVVLARTMR